MTFKSLAERPARSTQPGILLDSFSDIDFMEADAIGSSLLLQATEFDGQLWPDHSHLPYREMFSRLDRGAPFPKAGELNATSYSSILERMLRNAPHVLALHPTNYMSNGLSVARQSAQVFPGRVTVVDGRTVSSGLALQAAWAGEEFRKGRDPVQVIEDLRQLRYSQRTLVFMKTLKYLPTPVSQDWRRQLGPEASVVVGRPGNDPKMVATPTSPALGLRVLQQYLQRYARSSPGAHLTLFHTDAPDEAAHLRDLAEQLGFLVHWTVRPGLLYAAQIGPNAFGFSMLPRDLPADAAHSVA